MTGWTVLEALGVGIAVLLLAWTLLLYVPFRSAASVKPASSGGTSGPGGVLALW